jgi:hypothetical protein
VGYDGSRSYNGSFTDIGHHHGGASNPTAGTDGDAFALVPLFTNGHVRVVGTMSLGAARNMDGRPDQCVSANRYQT